MSARKPKKTAKTHSPGKIDEQVEETFPASDPPAFMGGKHIVGAPRERETPSTNACKPKSGRASSG